MLRPQELDVPAYNFGAQKKAGTSSSTKMFKVHHRLSHGVRHFHFFSPKRILSNGLLSDLNRDCMQKLRPWEVDILANFFGFHKNIGVSYYRVFSLQHIWRHVFSTFHYFSPCWILSNGLSRYPNGDRIKKLCASKLDVPTYHIKVHKIVCISYYTIIFRVHCNQRDSVCPFHCCPPPWVLLNGFLSDPKSYPKFTPIGSWSTNLPLLCSQKY